MYIRLTEVKLYSRTYLTIIIIYVDTYRKIKVCNYTYLTFRIESKFKDDYQSATKLLSIIAM